MTPEGHMVRPAARLMLRAEWVLSILALLSLVLVPVRMTTIYSGLPAHPLFLHVPVILIPLVALGALLVAARPSWIPRYGVSLSALTVAALASTLVTVGSGGALRTALHLDRPRPGGGGVAGAPARASELIARHAHAADILRLLMLAFTAMVILTLLGHRVAVGRSTGRRQIDDLLSRPPILVALRATLAALAIACGYFAFHTGDLGAKAVWSGRLSNHGSFAPPPGVGPGGAGLPGSGAGAGSGSGSR